MTKEINKYYTPNISDFYNEYEFEYKLYDEDMYLYINEWNNSIFDSRSGLGHDLTHQLNEGIIRTKYLDKEDIESLGYKQLAIRRDGGTIAFSIDNFLLTFYGHNILMKNVEQYRTIIVQTIDKGTTLYQGECKSKNELKKLMQMLDINYNM